ncbi:CCXG family PEP-CTERM protein [Paraglaciecola aquimarina]|uniref:CCXG family PEP-CTERM protein n=1 Tax=Paraglaciecola algarum TaxID=3050085 RepID=A0ABS9DCB0_9ALTE|nr:CCXG family PEP-CTERM protein [Paraglaciecola sp. G1-23]MCF2949657.1 CCXG family PEP-CTERM protein [Paraglaciecola sp. G1-23]
MFKYLIVIVMLLVTSNTQAALISLQSLSINNTFDAANGFKAYWQNQTFNASQPIYYENINFENIKTGGYSLNLLSISFELPLPITFSILAGLDAHHGADIYVNDTMTYSNNDDLWWSKKWPHKDVVELEQIPLLAGLNSIDIFWAESCCNGPNSVMFSVDNALPIFLSGTALQSEIPQVSAPNNLTLFALGLCLLIWFSRKPLKNEETKTKHEHKAT